MYSDDDLKDERDALFMPRDCYPYLHSYGEHEEECRRVAIKGKSKTTIASAEVTETINKIRAYRVLTFFKTVQGFYKGNLDLGGRHAERYFDVSSRWSAYMADFISLIVPESRSEDFEDGVGCQVMVTDEDWERFCKTWKVPMTFERGILLRKTQATFDIVAAHHGIPRIQEKCLLDLPLELLDIVLGVTSDVSVQRFSVTCRQLRELGRRHSFKHRIICLKREGSFYNLISFENEEKKHIALAARESTMAYCRHLENHKDLRHLKSLLVHNEWTNLYRVQHWDDPMSVLENGHFFTPLLRSVRQIIMASGSLTSLSISYLKLSYNLLISICDLPNLNVFSLFFCKLSKKFQRVLDKGIRSNSIRNLEIYATDDTYLRCLCLTSVCLNLYNLCIESALPPPESIWDKCYFLPSLKYLYLGRTSPSKLPVFVDWFRRALDGTPLALTRLKIEFEHGVPDAELIAFLQALNDAPLEILSVYGVSQVDGRLVEAIAEYFSHLLGLTIHRRNSRPNTRVKRVTWPLPVSNYLRQLSAFSRLRHFGWNNSAFPVQIFTPYFMQVFENQAFDEPDLACRDIDSEWLSNAKELTVLFGIHCPTLCSVSWVDEDDFRIIRSDEGVIRAEVWDLGLPYDNPWDPCRPWVAPFN